MLSFFGKGVNFMHLEETVFTRGQKFAQLAFECIKLPKCDKEYVSFAKKFPTLIHTCGLAQALAFAQAKAPSNLEHLSIVMGASDLLEKSRTEQLAEYLILSRMALEASGWLKRYAEALPKTCVKGGLNASVTK
jgi:CRISPR-associated protein Cmr5